MPYLVLKTVTAQNVNGDTFTHEPNTVISEWELSDIIRAKIADGQARYRTHFEPLTADEALHYRVKATIADPPRFNGGERLEAPWEDYVGLHPEEIISRMKASSSTSEVEAVKAFERAGMNRSMIVDYTAPVEREPFTGYNEMGIREVLAKLAILDDRSIAEVAAYEVAHRRRPAIIQYEREVYESPTEGEPVHVGSKEPVAA